MSDSSKLTAFRQFHADGRRNGTLVCEQHDAFTGRTVCATWTLGERPWHCCSSRWCNGHRRTADRGCPLDGLVRIGTVARLSWHRHAVCPELVSGRKPPLLHEICDEPSHFRRGFGHATGRTDTTEGCSASNRSTFSTSGHRRPFPSPCAGPGGRSPQAMAALRQRGVFDGVQPHACAVAQADRCGAGWRPVSTMQRCVQTHRRRGSAPCRDRDAQGC